MQKDYGMSFRDMVGLIKTDPLELMYRLNHIDYEKVEQAEAKRRARKPIEAKSKKKAPTSNKDVSAMREKNLKEILGVFKEN